MFWEEAFKIEGKYNIVKILENVECLIVMFFIKARYLYVQHPHI
jgi:hypothetical protein